MKRMTKNIWIGGIVFAAAIGAGRFGFGDGAATSPATRPAGVSPAIGEAVVSPSPATGPAEQSAAVEGAADSALAKAQAESAAGDQESEATAAARKAMTQRLDLSVDQKPLSAVIDYLGSQVHVNTDVNWKELKAEGVDRNTPVTEHLAQVSGDRALRAVLGSIGGDAARLGYTIDDGVVTISTVDDLNSAKYQSVRVYNVRDLLTIPPSPNTVQTNMAQQEVDRLNSLVDLITTTVAAESWRDNGGTIGSIREIDGLLVINQTKDNQAAIAELLAKMRKAGRVSP